MADLRRLGRRGSYRLGRVGRPAATARLPRQHHPSFRPAGRGRAGAWLAGGLAAAALIAAGAAAAGWWFLPFLAGLAAGAASRYGRVRLRIALPAVLAVAAVGWGAPLAWESVSGLPVRAVARTVAALAGLPAHASVVLAAVLVVAMLQAAVGLWLGRVLMPEPAR